jgi:hypothetical protein
MGYLPNAKLVDGNLLIHGYIHAVPALLTELSTASGSFVFVALIPLLETGKSPVLKEPEPVNILEELVGDRNTESPK